MKFDPTKPVQTRDGRKARIICTDMRACNSAYSIIALVTEEDGNEIPYHLMTDGRRSAQHNFLSNNDLVNTPETFERTIWVNISKIDGHSSSHATRKLADLAAWGDRIACVQVTIRGNVGDGL